MGPLSNLNTSRASTAVPLIADAQMGPFRVEQLTVDQPEGNRTWPQLKAKLVSVIAMASSEGHPINAGWPLFITFPLGTKDNPAVAPDWAGPAIAKFQDGVLGTGDEGNKKGKPTRPDLTEESLPEYIGKTVVCKIGIKKPKDEQYTDQNVVKTYTFPGDIAA